MDQQQQEQTIACLLCCEEVTCIGIGECNHKEFCFTCVYKLRELKQSTTCPICNAQNNQVIITDNLELNFDDYEIDELKCWDEKWQIYITSKNTQTIMNGLRLIKCFVPNCTDTAMFQQVNFLKKHLKEKHKKFLCDLCVDNKLCVLSEQKLYDFESLSRHTKNGDYDEAGIYALHPFCSFCKEGFFDEEAFYKHLLDQHLTCNLCEKEHKFRYYQNYSKLETHFKISHYICDDIGCQEKGYVAFRSAAEKDLHVQKIHGSVLNAKYEQEEVNFGGKKKKNQNTINVSQLMNFNYGEPDQVNKQNKNNYYKENSIKDNEGVDLSNQFLSQRRIKQRESVVTDHADQLLDLRDFYHHKYDEEAIAQERSFFDKVLGFNRNNGGGRGRGGLRNNNRGGRGGRGRGRGRGCFNNNNNDGDDQQQQQDSNNKDGESNDDLRFNTPILEDICILKHQQVPYIDQNKFDSRVEKLVPDDIELNKYYDQKDAWFRRKCSSKQFVETFFKVLGVNAAIRLFPHFIRCIDPKRAIQIIDLDKLYLSEIKKLPVKYENILNQSETYSDFLVRLKHEIELNIKSRIQSKKLDLKTKYTMEKSRIKQFYEILKRVSTTEMAHIKFGTNFGISVETISHFTKKVYFASPKNVQKYLDNIEDNNEILHLYVYISECADLVKGKKQEKHQNSHLLLKNFFIKFPEIYKQYKNINQDDSSDEEAPTLPKKSNYDDYSGSYNKKGKQNQRNIQNNNNYSSKQQNKKKNSQPDDTETDMGQEEEKQADDQDFDPKNKFEFPNIIRKESMDLKKEQKKKEYEKKQNTLRGGTWGGSGIETQQAEDVELFPSLGGKGTSQQVDLSKKQKSEKEVEKRKEDLALKSQKGPSLEDQIYGRDKAQKMSKQKKILTGADSDSEEENKLRNIGAINIKKKKKGGKAQVILAGGFK